MFTLVGCRSARKETSLYHISAALAVPRDGKQQITHQAEPSSEAAPADCLQQAVTAGVSIRPGLLNISAVSPSETPSAGVKPTSTPSPNRSHEANHDSTTGQQLLPATQQPARVNSASPLPASPVAAPHESPMQPSPPGQLCAQPGAFGCTDLQREVQQWSALFAQAYLQQEVEPVQHDGAASPLVPVQHSADTLQRGNARHMADCQDLQQGDPWLTAFSQAHLQGFTVSVEHAALVEALEGFAGRSLGHKSLQLDAALEHAAARGSKGASLTAIISTNSQDHHPEVPQLRIPTVTSRSSSSSSNSIYADGTVLEDMGSSGDLVLSDTKGADGCYSDEMEVTSASSSQAGDSKSDQQQIWPTSPPLSAHTLQTKDLHR